MLPNYQTLAKFRSKKGGGLYFVKKNLKTGDFSCDCKGWIYNRHCKHIDYFKDNPYILLTRVPTYQEAVRMVWGRDKQEKEKWTVKHLKEIEL